MPQIPFVQYFLCAFFQAVERHINILNQMSEHQYFTLLFTPNILFCQTLQIQTLQLKRREVQASANCIQYIIYVLCYAHAYKIICRCQIFFFRIRTSERIDAHVLYHTNYLQKKKIKKGTSNFIQHTSVFACIHALFPFFCEYILL